MASTERQDMTTAVDVHVEQVQSVAATPAISEVESTARSPAADSSPAAVFAAVEVGPQDEHTLTQSAPTPTEDVVPISAASLVTRTPSRGIPIPILSALPPVSSTAKAPKIGTGLRVIPPHRLKGSTCPRATPMAEVAMTSLRASLMAARVPPAPESTPSPESVTETPEPITEPTVTTPTTPSTARHYELIVDDDEVGDEDISESDGEGEARAGLIVSPVGRGCFCSDPTQLLSDIFCSRHDHTGSRCYSTHAGCLMRIAGASYDRFELGQSCFLCRECVNSNFETPDARFFECVFASPYGHIYNPVNRRVSQPNAATVSVSLAAQTVEALKETIRESMHTTHTGRPVAVRDLDPSELESIKKATALKLLAGITTPETLAVVEAALAGPTTPKAFALPKAMDAHTSPPRSPTRTVPASPTSPPLSPPTWLYFQPVCPPTTTRQLRVMFDGRLLVDTRILVNARHSKRRRHMTLKEHQLKKDASDRLKERAKAQRTKEQAKTTTTKSTKRPAATQATTPIAEKKRRLAPSDSTPAPEVPLHSVNSAPPQTGPPPIQHSGSSFWCRCDCAQACARAHNSAQAKPHASSSGAAKTTIDDFLHAICTPAPLASGAPPSSALLPAADQLLPAALLTPLLELATAAALSFDNLQRMSISLLRQMVVAAIHATNKEQQSLFLAQSDAFVRLLDRARFHPPPAVANQDVIVVDRDE